MSPAKPAIVADPGVARAGSNADPQGAQARPVVPVAVGVLLRADGSFLLTSRPRGKPYAGYWEFPGGKFEEGESGPQALARELKEELGIEIDLQSTLEWHIQRGSGARLVPSAGASVPGASGYGACAGVVGPRAWL